MKRIQKISTLAPEDVVKVISVMNMAFAEAWCLMGCAKFREMVQLTS